MEYYPDTRQGYQQICCRMARAISRGVELLDHIIVADGDFVSMEASGLLYG